MEKKKKKKNIFLFLIIYFTIIIISEQFYRNPLFKYSYETFEPIIQDKLGKDNFISFIFKTASFLGRNILVYGINITICIFFYSYQEIIITLLTIFTSISLVGYFKILYHNPRPYWINSNIKLIDDLGYGNPSGHSFTSSTGYLCCFYLISNKLKKRIFYFIYFILLLLFGFLLLCLVDFISLLIVLIKLFLVFY